MQSLTTEQWIQAFYVAYFGRAADPEGLNYWIDLVTKQVVDLAGAAENFAPQPEATSQYAYFDTVFNQPGSPVSDDMYSAFIVQVYENLFERPPDEPGKAYWIQQLKSGASSPGAFIANVIYAAMMGQNGESTFDWATVYNKAQAAEFFTDTLQAKEMDWTVPLSDAVTAILDQVDGNSNLDDVKQQILEALTPIPFTPVLALAAVASEQGGFVVQGESAGDKSGWSVAAVGDVNGDGLGDFIVGAPEANASGGAGAGKSYVVFGKKTGTPIDLTAVVNGTGGFVIHGENAHDNAGFSVAAAGDVNGDGLADLLVGAPYADPLGRLKAGNTYLVFGQKDGTAVNLSAVANGVGGVVIRGEAPGDLSGWSVSCAGDVNGDGLADVVVSAPLASSGGTVQAGRAYVIFGKSSTTPVELSVVANGTGGFVLEGMNAGASWSVSSAGDVNGDGLADLVVGAPEATSTAGANAGKTYVIFGKKTSSAVKLSDVEAGQGGFVIHGAKAGDASGHSVAYAGDVNGDGLADVVIGAPRAGLSGNLYGGKTYVVFGKTDATAVKLSDVESSKGGFVIVGGSDSAESGWSVSYAGDVNGDGLADLLIGADLASPTGAANAGKTYVVFGKADGKVVNLSDVESGQGGFVIHGESASDFSGFSVAAAGDINGDGLADLLVAAYGAGVNGAFEAGKTYVIFGSTMGAFAKTAVDRLGTSGNDTITDSGMALTLVGDAGNDTLTATGASVLYGGSGNDTFTIGATMITALESDWGSGGNTQQLARIDGGSGLDTLALKGSGLTLDLTKIANPAVGLSIGGSRLTSIERVDLTGTGNNTLRLTAQNLLDLTGVNVFKETGRRELLIEGNSGDTLDLLDGSGTSGWNSSGEVTILGVNYKVWNHTSLALTLYVNPDVAVI